MPHPEVAKLIEHATRGSAGAAVEGHVRTCEECAREVGRWSRTVAAYVWRDSDTNGADQPCLDDHAIAALAEGSLSKDARESAVEHVARCAGCRSALASVARTLASSEVREEVERLHGGPKQSWLRVTVPLAAAATLAIVFLADRPAVAPEPHRSPATLLAPVTIAPNGATTSVQALRWHAVSGADRYRVTLFDGDGVVLWESVVADTIVGLPPDVPLEPGRSYYWLVAARRGFDRWDTSDLIEFSVTAAGTR